MNMVKILDEWFIDQHGPKSDTYASWLEGVWVDTEVEWDVWMGFFCIYDQEVFE